MNIPQLIFNGVALGSIFALAAIGLTLTYGILRLSNFAHGDFMTVGAYSTWQFHSWGLNLWLAMICGVAVTVAIMLIGELLLWKPMRDRKASPTSLIILSIGLAIFLRGGILIIWGSSLKSYDLPMVPAMDFFGIKVAFYRLVAITLALLAVGALFLLLRFSKIGKAMRAVADNLDLARVSGINVETVVLSTWVLTGILTALAGANFGLIAVLRPDMGWLVILPLFASVILGGIGNPYGAVLGAMIIAIAQELSVAVPFLGSEYKIGVALGIMILVLFIRPQGLFRGTA
ncbi:MAG: branched-chain amino acid ABC transporter permease [Cyanobacteria bacterium P01_H01_bin.15]